jgi:hypothetical protein
LGLIVVVLRSRAAAGTAPEIAPFGLGDPGRNVAMMLLEANQGG